MPSFDIVSEVDVHEFTNAVDQAGRIIQTRFDFKGIEAKFERNELTVTIFAEADFQITQMEDMLRTALITSSGLDCETSTMFSRLFAARASARLITLSPRSPTIPVCGSSTNERTVGECIWYRRARRVPTSIP